MKITESQIRKLVREELEKINEMPYGGSLGLVKGSGDSSMSGFSDSFGENRPGAENFAKSSRFGKLAQKYFGRISNNAFVAPYVGDIKGLHDAVSGDDSLTRVKLLNLKSEIHTLENYGFSIPENLNPESDTVILYTTNSASKGILATPWMLIHAIFDSNYAYTNLTPSLGQIVSEISDDFERKKYAIGGDGGFDDGYDWSSLLTMKSARDGQIDNQSDAYAEIMCQEILTTGGFRIDVRKATSRGLLMCAGNLLRLKPRITKCANEFLSNIKGKLIILAAN